MMATPLLAKAPFSAVARVWAMPEPATSQRYMVAPRSLIIASCAAADIV
ncbi:hypothetical protein ACNSZH_24975 [Burkholderia gladioli]